MMQVLVKKWGNSASVRIPASVMAASRMVINQPVDVREENGRIVIEPVCDNELDRLLADIRPDNLHGEVSFGPAMGKEAF